MSIWPYGEIAIQRYSEGFGTQYSQPWLSGRGGNTNFWCRPCAAESSMRDNVFADLGQLYTDDLPLTEVAKSKRYTPSVYGDVKHQEIDILQINPKKRWFPVLYGCNRRSVGHVKRQSRLENLHKFPKPSINLDYRDGNHKDNHNFALFVASRQEDIKA